MTHCRMCSQRLTRPGKLCRECERELERARLAAASVGDLASALALADASLAAEPAAVSGAARLPVSLVAAAFAVGVAGGVALWLAQRVSASESDVSVMLDRNVSVVKPRVVQRRSGAASTRPAMSPHATAAAPPPIAFVAASPSPAPHAYDRVLALSDALARCENETLFERIACEQRARTRYCDGATDRLPQCLDETPRDHGQ